LSQPICNGGAVKSKGTFNLNAPARPVATISAQRQRYCVTERAEQLLDSSARSIVASRSFGEVDSTLKMH
jgi:SLT domain-containing protein